MKARQEVTKATGGQYRRARRKEKSKLLDQFMETTDYSRWYARLVLRQAGRHIQTDKQTIVVVEGKRPGKWRAQRLRARRYSTEVRFILLTTTKNRPSLPE